MLKEGYFFSQNRIIKCSRKSTFLIQYLGPANFTTIRARILLDFMKSTNGTVDIEIQ